MTVKIDQAQRDLPELIRRTRGGEEVVIAGDDGRAVARLVPVPAQSAPRAGFLKGKIEIVADDESHLDDFAEHRG